MMMITKNDYISVGTNLFIKTSIYFQFWSYNHCFSITKQKQQKICFVYLLFTHKIHTTIMICGSAPAFLNILVSSTSLNILPWWKKWNLALCAISERRDQKYPSNMPQIIQQSKLATFWRTITIWAGSKKRPAQQFTNPQLDSHQFQRNAKTNHYKG